MDKLIDAFASQAPGMAIMAIVVIAFIKYLGKKDKQINAAFERRDETVAQMHKENLDAREQSRIVIEKNTIAAAQNTVAMQNMTNLLRAFLKRQRNGHNGSQKGLAPHSDEA